LGNSMDINLNHDEYKKLEAECKEFKEAIRYWAKGTGEHGLIGADVLDKPTDKTHQYYKTVKLHLGDMTITVFGPNKEIAPNTAAGEEK